MDLKYKILRSIFYLLGFLALILYLFAWFMVGVNWQQELNAQNSMWMKIYYLVTWFVFIPGFPLMLLAMYFFVYLKDLYMNTVGILIVGIFFFMHLWVETMAAHTNPINSFVIQFSEALITMFVFYIIFRVNKKNKRSPDGV